MDLDSLPPPILVQDDQAARGLLDDLARHDEIAVDTEADSFYSYREKVCLVQFTVGERDYLLDPLAGVDLAPFGKVLADPSKTKVFHDGEYDILILKRDHRFEFAGVFDTRVAAAALGMESPGLASVLAERFGVELDKSMQRSDWARRPLSDKQIAYARLDTRFLISLMHSLREELAERERTMIVEGECRRLEALRPVPLVSHPDDFVKIKGSRTLAPRERQALRELFVLRERLAEAQDVPPFRVMNNQLLLLLARSRARSVHQLERTKGFTRKLSRKLGDDVITALRRADELGPLERLPPSPKRDGTEGLDDEGLELYERLKRWRKGVGERHRIESSYLLNRHVMVRIASERPRDPAGLEATDGLLPWQLELFGKDLVELVRTFERDLASGAVQKRRRWRR